MTVHPNYRYWSLRELWEVRQSACLLLSIEPGSTIPAEIFFKWSSIVDMVRDAMDIGTLKPFDCAENTKPLEDRRLHPKEFLNWWQSKGFNIPTELAHLLDTPVPEGQNPAESTPRPTDRLNGQEKTTRQQQDTRMAQSERHPADLVVIVDEVNKTVSVFSKAGSGKETKFTHRDIVGRGDVTWSLLVAFARCNGSLEGNTAADVKKLNTSANRKNLSSKLVATMNLDRSPIVEGRTGVMRFQSIQLAGDKSSPDAMDRKTISTDDQTTEFLKNHGDDMPVLD